jgi:hypothetical protein
MTPAGISSPSVFESLGGGNVSSVEGRAGEVGVSSLSTFKSLGVVPSMVPGSAIVGASSLGVSEAVLSVGAAGGGESVAVGLVFAGNNQPLSAGAASWGDKNRGSSQ